MDTCRRYIAGQHAFDAFAQKLLAKLWVTCDSIFILPLLGILRLRARDLAGYGLLQLAVQAHVVFFFCWLFARNLRFIPPMS